MTSAPFTATKFDREYAVCDEDCAEFLSGVQFEIPYQQQKENDSADRLAELEDFAKQAGVALRDAWLVLNELAIVRDLASPAESESVLRSEKFDSAAYRVRTALSRHALMKGRT